MTQQTIAEALLRARDVFERRPAAGQHEDAPASAHWHGGTRVQVGHDNGTQVATDMPGEFGGGGAEVSPGWLFRAGLAACASTSIVMDASLQGIPLTLLDVKVQSWSDARGMLGMLAADGQPVHAGPGEVRMTVRIAAEGVSAKRLRALVQGALGHSPIPSALRTATPLGLEIETNEAAETG